MQKQNREDEGKDLAVRRFFPYKRKPHWTLWALLLLVFSLTLGILNRKHVYVVENGKETRVAVPFSAREVQDLLKGPFALHPRDRVFPLSDTPLADSMEIRIKRAVPVTIQLDKVTLHVRSSQDRISGLLAEQHLTLARRDSVVPPSSTPVVGGMTVLVRRAIPVTLKVGETKIYTSSSQTTVRDLLQEEAVSLTSLDRVSPSLLSLLSPGMVVTVTKVTQSRQEAIESLNFSVVYRPLSSLPLGRREVIQEGRNGQARRVYQVTAVNGKPASKSLISTATITPSSPMILGYGTQPRFLLASRGSFAGYPMLEMEATGYDPGPISCGRYADGYTSIGLRAGYGVVAVDPSVIPLRTRLYIEGYGYAMAGDVGSAIKGNRIDLGFDTYQEAMNFGRRAVRVYIIGR